MKRRPVELDHDRAIASIHEAGPKTLLQLIIRARHPSALLVAVPLMPLPCTHRTQHTNAYSKPFALPNRHVLAFLLSPERPLY